MDGTSTPDAGTPLTYDDISVGDRFEAGSTTLTESAIVAFARGYDPQPFHVDPDAADDSMFDGLVASGVHTFAVCQRLATRAFFARTPFLGGRGVDEMRWHRPVRPGDTLSVSVEVAAKRPSESDPGRGYVDLHVVGSNARDETVISWTGLAILGRRE